jgi:hypothetical protein
MPGTSDIFNLNRVFYRRATLEDIPDHFAKIKHWIPEEEHIEFQERMEDAIDQGNAWCTELTFLYYQSLNYRVANAVAIYGKESAYEMLTLFQGVFAKEDRNTAHMRFKMHPGKELPEYWSMITSTSAQRWNQDNDHPLSVDVQKFRKKMENIMKRRESR